MRYAVLSDVHANLPALRAVLDAVHSDSRVSGSVDAYLVTGDLVGYGAFPNECIKVLASLDAVCVAGNHDLIAIGALEPTRTVALARQTLAWTASVLSPESRAYLATLPRTAVVGDALLAHGSVDDPQEYVYTAPRANELLASLPTRLLLLGHTHHQWAHGLRLGTVLHRRTGAVGLSGDTRWLLNAGSVGQSRDPDLLARFAVLEIAPDRNDGTMEFRAVPYDIQACQKALARAGLPVKSYHRYSSRPERQIRRLRRRLRRLVARLH